ncbi:MAG: DUF6171 family protein [Lachnospiraceae bacterium]
MPQWECRKCLLEKLGNKELKERILLTIEAIPVQERADEVKYQKRLKSCQECEWLFNAMCRRCGCFVEVRAAKDKQYCPDIHPKW